MTLMDGFFVGMAAVEVIAVGAMGFVAAKFVEMAKSGQSKMQPALREVKTLADTGKAIATHARADGTTVVNRVKDVSSLVMQRVETTKRVVGELKPHTQEAVSTVKTTIDRAQKISSITGRLARLKNAAEAAAQAARTP